MEGAAFYYGGADKKRGCGHCSGTLTDIFNMSLEFTQCSSASQSRRLRHSERVPVGFPSAPD